MVIQVPKRTGGNPYLKAIARLDKVRVKVNAAVTQLRETGGGKKAADALEEILSKISDGHAFWLALAQFEMLRDPKNSFRHDDLLKTVKEINEIMFAVATLSSKLQMFRDLLPDREDLPERLEISTRGARAIHEIAYLSETAQQFGSVIKELFGKHDPGGPALSKRAQVDPFDVLVESLADAWLHSGRQLNGTDAKNFELILYAVYERLTGNTELPARRWKKLKPQLRKRTQPPRKKSG